MADTVILKNVHPKFASVVRQLYNIYQHNVKCKVFINFGLAEDDVSFRYESIDPIELQKLALSITKGYTPKYSPEEE